MIKKLQLKNKFKNCHSFSIYPCGKYLIVETTQVNIMQLEMVVILQTLDNWLYLLSIKYPLNLHFQLFDRPA